MNNKLELISNKEKNEMIIAVATLKRQIPEIIEHGKIVAKIRKASFDAYLKEGFTEAQALELCKT